MDSRGLSKDVERPRARGTGPVGGGGSEASCKRVVDLEDDRLVLLHVAEEEERLVGDFESAEQTLPVRFW